MEAQFADVAEIQPELLAHHYSEAGLAALALPSYQQAGAKAVARSAYREAVALFERALGVMQHLPNSPDTIAQAIDLRLALRTALRPLGEFGRTLVVLHEAETLAAALSDARRLGQVAVYLAVQFRMMGAYDQARAAAQRALAVATADGDVVLHALAQQYLGITYQDQGDYGRAIDCLEQTLAALAGARQRELCGVDLCPPYSPGLHSPRAMPSAAHSPQGAPLGPKGCALPRRWLTPVASCLPYGGLGCWPSAKATCPERSPGLNGP